VKNQIEDEEESEDENELTEKRMCLWTNVLHDV
jgi:hypothetical protein